MQLANFLRIGYNIATSTEVEVISKPTWFIVNVLGNLTEVN